MELDDITKYRCVHGQVLDGIHPRVWKLEGEIMQQLATMYSPLGHC